MTVSLHQQAFAGISNTNADNGLARGAAVGIFRRALSNIEPLVTQLPNIDSSGSSFKLRNGCPSNRPLRTRSRHQADHTRGQLASHTSDGPSKEGRSIDMTRLPTWGSTGSSRISSQFRWLKESTYFILLPDFPPYQAHRVRHPMVRRLEIPRLKGLFTVGSCSPKTSENMFLLGRNSPNATNNRQKPAVVSQGKYYVSERLAFRWSGIEPKPK